MSLTIMFWIVSSVLILIFMIALFPAYSGLHDSSWVNFAAVLGLTVLYAYRAALR